VHDAGVRRTFDLTRRARATPKSAATSDANGGLLHVSGWLADAGLLRALCCVAPRRACGGQGQHPGLLNLGGARPPAAAAYRWAATTARRRAGRRRYSCGTSRSWRRAAARRRRGLPRASPPPPPPQDSTWPATGFFSFCYDSNHTDVPITRSMRRRPLRTGESGAFYGCMRQLNSDSEYRVRFGFTHPICF
jgi:hypothetical protein